MKKADSLEEALTQTISMDDKISLSFITDSQDSEYIASIAERDIRPKMSKTGYEERDIFKLLYAIQEGYSNAVIHGNQAGKPYDYESRGRSVPRYADENHKKNVTLEIEIHKEYFMAKISDEGGRTSECIVQSGLDDAGLPMTNHGRGFTAFDSIMTFWGHKNNEKGCTLILFRYMK